MSLPWAIDSTIRWDRLLVRSILWLSLEALFGALGIDTLVDYSEFLTDTKRNEITQVSTTAIVTTKKLWVNLLLV
jgi:hypothetical protein